MAVYHLKMSVGSRAGSQSALAKSEYIEREGRYERDREELEHRESENMPEWAEDDPRSYWAGGGTSTSGANGRTVPGSPSSRFPRSWTRPGGGSWPPGFPAG